MTKLDDALDDIESVASKIGQVDASEVKDAKASEIIDLVQAIREANESGELTYMADGESVHIDPDFFPPAPTDGVPVYITVAMQDTLWRFTASGDLITATDVPAHIYGGLEGWKRRGGYQEADYVHDADLNDDSEPPVLTVPVGTLRHLLTMARQAYPEANEEDCVQTVSDLLGEG